MQLVSGFFDFYDGFINVLDILNEVNSGMLVLLTCGMLLYVFHFG